MKALLALLSLACVDVEAQLLKVLMEGKAKNHGAVCLDGSPGMFFFAPNNASKPETQNKWILFFQGGGWCYDELDCLYRSRTPLGSSTLQPDETTLDGMMRRDCERNPEFCNYNHVYLTYCDGNSFAGNLDAPITVNNTQLYFRGKRVMDAILETLVESYGFGAATHVLLSGCSAGGLAAYMHTDYVSDFVTANSPNLKQFASAPVSGFFLDHKNIAGEAVYTEEMNYTFTMTNASGGVNQACIAANGDAPWKCSMAQYTYPHIKSRTFILNSAMDSWQTWCILTPTLPAGYPQQKTNANGMCNQFPSMNDCVSNPVQHCNASQVNVINDYATSFLDDVDAATVQRPGNGIFAHSCHLHCEAISLSFFAITIDGVIMRDAVYNWWNADPTSPASGHTYLPCLYATGTNETDRRCNPTCPLAAVPPNEYV